jgi:SRSO17 transposase
MRTRTRDTSRYGYEYVSGILRLEQGRTLAGISRVSEVNEQALQHFTSNSPWDGAGLIGAIQQSVGARAELQTGAMLLLDESGEEREGTRTVGAARQYLGRAGKVDMGQMGVFAALVKGQFWTWVDGELYVPERWFSADYEGQRAQAGLPVDRTFESKLALGLRLAKRVRAQGIAFDAVACDTFYGRNGWFRATLAAAQFEYMAEVPVSQRVYLSTPTIGLPTNKKGPKTERLRVLGPTGQRVDALGRRSDLAWHPLTIRASDRGHLTAEFAAQRVWTVWEGADKQPHVRQEWLVIRRDPNGRCSYAFSNAPQATPLTVLAQRKCQRSFVEQTNREAKSDFGWDEIQTTKYLAWHHHLALTILAAWFIAETKLDWADTFARDPALLAQYEVDVLPALSVANVRTLLRAALPLPHLDSEQATALVVKHLVNRTRSRASRLKNRAGP